jgi:hypothetical protein
METILSGIFALLIGSVGVGAGLNALRNRRTLDRWPTTKGRVIERGIFRVNTASRSAFRYAPLVRYAYQVEGKEFVNDSINPKVIQLPSHSTREWAQKRSKAWADEVNVHYNPASPNESFLAQTPRFKLYAVILASLAAILFGLLFLLSYFQK